MHLLQTPVHPRRRFQQQTPISCLTDELLETIFQFHVTWTYSQRVKNAEELLKLTHVCQWWRALALACPSLWRNIEVCRPHLAQEYLKRRGPSGPISFLSSPGQHLPKLQDFERLIRYANRMQHVDVAFGPADMRLFLYRLGPQFNDVSSMRLIQVSADGPAEELHLARDLASLRQLALDGVTVNWNSIFNLTALVLCRLRGPKAPSMSDLQLIFNNNPGLEEVSVHDVAVKPSDTTHLAEAPHRLRLLRLSMPSSSTVSIISGLFIPASTRIEIRTWGATDQITSIFPVHNGRLHSFISITKDSTLSIRSRKITIRHTESLPFSDHYVRLVIEVTQNISVAILPILPKVFDLSLLTTLEVDFMHPDLLRPDACRESLKITRQFLASLFNLVTLRVCQALADIVAPLLGESASFPGVAVPRLTRLSFGDPSQMWWNFPTTANGDPAGGWLQPIAMGLRARRALTFTKLGTLEFIGIGHIDRNSTNLLLPFVDNIFNSVLCPGNSPCPVCSRGPNLRAGW